MKPVVIVGAGLSGLAAGVDLSSRGIPVLLLEERPYAGGRARSFVDETTGDVIDNGQHVLIAGYERTMQFLATIGSRHHVAVQPTLVLAFHHPVRGFCTLRFPLLPSPFHLLGGIASTDLLSPIDKLRLLRAGRELLFPPTGGAGNHSGLTIAQWLDAAGQSAETKRSFWEPLALAIMNEHAATASARVFLHALHTAFVRHRRNAALVVPAVGLSSLFSDPAQEFIRTHGGSVRCRTTVVATRMDGGRVVAVRTREGEEIPCTSVILAVPPREASALLPEPMRAEGFMKEMAAVPMSPIVSIHLWFPADFMPQEHLGLIGKRIQWVFHRRKILREKGAGSHLSAVISAGDREVEMTNEQLVALASEDLVQVFGNEAGAPVHAVVIREKRATFSCAPAVDLLRPDQATPIPNMFLAGDWTATGLPATIEGAVISGERCAALAAQRAG